MRKLLKKLPMLLSCMALLSSIGIAQASEQTTQDQFDEKKISFNYNLEKREALGLSTNVEYVSDVIKERDEMAFHDIFLTKEEEKALKERMKHLNGTVPKIKKLMQSSIKENFSGLYVRQDEGGVLYIGTKKDTLTKELKNEAIKIFGKTDKLKFFEAPYSEYELESIHDQIYIDTEVLKKNGIEIIYVATDVINNKVEVGLKNNTIENQDYLVKNMVIC